MDLGLGEIMLVCFVALMVYGGRLPKVALAVGRSLGELKRGLRETTDMVRREVEDVDPRPVVRRAMREIEKTTDEVKQAVDLDSADPDSADPDSADPDRPRPGGESLEEVGSG